MRYLLYTLVLSAVLLCSCSDTDDTLEETPEDLTTDIPNFSFLNFSTPGAVFQFQFDTFTQTGFFSDITALDGVEPAIERVYEFGDVAGMYAGNQVWLKDMRTGTVINGMNFFSEGDTEFRNWTINTETVVFSGYHDSINFDNFLVRVINLNNNVISNIPIGNIGQTVEAVFSQDHLVFYENGLDVNGNIQAKLVFVNINTMESLGIQQFENTNIIGTVFGESNDVFVFYNNGTYTRFDLTSFTALDSGDSSLQVQLNGGEIVEDSKIFYVRTFPEPAVSDPLPAIYNIATQEETIIDVTPVLEVLASENGWVNLIRTTIDYVPSVNSWLIGYRYTDASGTTLGGIAKFSSEAELLANLEVTDHPWNLVVLD
ncbi:hypothetical protein [uncultured Dokdonia sp.]|uniref:hypothetical protein n=1 Tax=uncultured Dokdonia sp. TaxID=575653 RepID=UPI0026075323|nr:hypothetical protein [uncultured Dokdonia sp.]